MAAAHDLNSLHQGDETAEARRRAAQRRESIVRDLGDLYREEETALYLGVSIRTLQKWRQVGGGPRFTKIGGRLVRYQKSCLDEFMQSGGRLSTSDGRQAQCA